MKKKVETMYRPDLEIHTYEYNFYLYFYNIDDFWPQQKYFCLYV